LLAARAAGAKLNKATAAMAARVVRRECRWSGLRGKFIQARLSSSLVPW